MDGDRFRKLDSIFREALRVDPTERERVVHAAADGDESLACEACALLEADAATHGALTTATLEPRRWTEVLREVADCGDGGGRDDEALSLPHDAIPGFRIVRRIGAGSMGVVYAAEQDVPRRAVAIKVLRPTIQYDDAAGRLPREAEVLARLHHPGIATIHGAGSFTGPWGIQAYLVMELVPGEPLHRSERVRSLPTGRKLELIAEIADAVDHAHRHGVIHCDLKPANIVVSADGTDGGLGLRPKILDFGIARVTRELGDGHTVERSRHGSLVGTPAYMSPEQAGMGVEDLDERSDVYALGVVAFELLTGRLPHEVRGLRPTDAARLIRRRKPMRVAAIDPSLRGDVDAIIAKALRRDRRRRHRTAGELATDIRRTLERAQRERDPHAA